MKQIETLLKDWNLLPVDHVIDDSLLLGILDKDKDDDFSYDDFSKNFPKYNSQEVKEFIETERIKMRNPM